MPLYELEEILLYIMFCQCDIPVCPLTSIDNIAYDIAGNNAQNKVDISDSSASYNIARSCGLRSPHRHSSQTGESEHLTFVAAPESTKLLDTLRLASQEKLTQQPRPPGRLHPSKLWLRVLHRCPCRIPATSPDRWGSYPRDQSLQSCHPRHRVYCYKY